MNKEYIPKDLNDCFVELKKLLEVGDIEKIKNGEEDNMAMCHHGLGRYLRNTWRLWRNSRLVKWFNDQGIFHPDDMSGIILDSFWRHLNSKSIELDKQIKFYQNYWEEIKKKGQ